MQHENTISQHLRDLLDVYPEVNISGIGSFAVIHKAAWIDSDNNELYPPTKTLSISPESDLAIDLLEEVAKKYKGQRDVVETIHRAVANSVKDLELSGETRIPEVGVVRIDEYKKLSLVDVHNKWLEGTAYLPVLSLHPVADGVSEDQPSPMDIYEPTLEKKGPVAEMSSEGLWKQSILPLIVIGIGVLSLLWYFNSCNDKIAPLETEQKVESLRGSLLQVDTINRINAEYKHFLTSEILSEGCKVVVGSYGQKNNAEAQSKELVKLGYHIQLSKNGDGYRVVIVFDCNEYNLKDYLDSITTQVASNAWYLSPFIKAEDL